MDRDIWARLALNIFPGLAEAVEVQQVDAEHFAACGAASWHQVPYGIVDMAANAP